MPEWNATVLGVDLRTWLTGGAIVLLIATGHLGLRWWARRRERRQRQRPLAAGESLKTRHWIARGISDAIPPIAFLLWLHGLHLALSMLAADYPTPWVTRGVGVIDWLRGAGTLLGLAWLLARIARTLEGLLKTFASRSEAGWDDVLLPFAGRALRIVLPLIALILGTPALAMSAEAKGLIQNAISCWWAPSPWSSSSSSARCPGCC